MLAAEVQPQTASQVVLIIDSDPGLSSELAKALVGPARDVIVCRDLESAKMVMEHRFITHIITDAQLSDSFAFEGLHVLESVRRNLSAIPVVITTANGSDDIRRAAERGGASAVLHKPIAVRDLEAFIPPVAGEVGTVTLVPTLDDVLDGRMLATAFQPIVWTENPEYVVGFEALTRLHSQSLFANPEFLFQYAQRKDRVVDLEVATATNAIRNGRDLVRLGILSLNIHAAVFSQADRFTDTVLDAAADARVPLERIVLEITEQAPLPSIYTVEAVAGAMRNVGLRFAFDDLGLAYSHLIAIAAVRPSYVKISQHFGTGCEADEVKRKIVQNIEHLAQSFSAEIVLEGIETAETAEFARRLGIRFGQGFYYARPTSKETLLAKYSAA